MFGFNEKICDSFVAAIKESFQSGTPIINLIAQIDEYKDKGIVEWYAVDQGNHAITFKLAGTDRRFRLGEKGLAPVNAVPPEDPETFNAPPHIRKASAERKCMAPACSCEETAEKADLGKPWHNIFGEISACTDCGAILGKGKTRCRYCEDRNTPIEDLAKALKAEKVTEVELSPCIVCGNQDIAISACGDGYYFAMCPKCKISSKRCESVVGAQQNWNTTAFIDYDKYCPNPCPICGGETAVSFTYTDSAGKIDRRNMQSSIYCKTRDCITVRGIKGVPPHMNLISRWRKLTEPFKKGLFEDSVEDRDE